MGAARLVLMRHAKSAYPAGVPDHDRPLSERGLRDLQAARRWFAGQGTTLIGERPTVLVSTALRAQMTWQGVEAELPAAVVEVTPKVYEAAVSTLIDLCAPSIDRGQHTLIVGHNPSVEALAEFIADPARSVAEWNQRDKYPTAAIAVLELDDDSWAQDSARVASFIVPRA